MITQSMTKLEGHPMTGLFDRCTLVSSLGVVLICLAKLMFTKYD